MGVWPGLLGATPRVRTGEGAGWASVPEERRPALRVSPLRRAGLCPPPQGARSPAPRPPAPPGRCRSRWVPVCWVASVQTLQRSPDLKAWCQQPALFTGMRPELKTLLFFVFFPRGKGSLQRKYRGTQRVWYPGGKRGHAASSLQAGSPHGRRSLSPALQTRPLGSFHLSLARPEPGSSSRTHPGPIPGVRAPFPPHLGCEPLRQELPAGELRLVSLARCSAALATLADPIRCLLRDAKVGCEGRVSPVPRNLQSKQRGLPYHRENKGRSSGTASGRRSGSSGPGDARGGAGQRSLAAPEAVKAACGRSEVSLAGAVGRERCGAGEGAAGGQMTGPHVTSQERPRTSTLCLHGVRSKKPTPADAPYRPRSSASRRAYIKGAAGRLPAGGTREATRRQVRGGGQPRRASEGRGTSRPV